MTWGEKCLPSCVSTPSRPRRRQQVKFDELWRRLEQPAGTQTTAGRIANGQPIYGRGRPQKSVSRTIEKLGREGIVRRVGRGAYEFTEPLFARYIRELTSPWAVPTGEQKAVIPRLSSRATA